MTRTLRRTLVFFGPILLVSCISPDSDRAGIRPVEEASLRRKDTDASPRPQSDMCRPTPVAFAAKDGGTAQAESPHESTRETGGQLQGIAKIEGKYPKRIAPENVPLSERIEYRVFEKWTIPNGGFGRVIVVEPFYRSRENFLTLGKQLWRDTRQDRNAVMIVFDDDLAAGSHRVPDEQMSKEALEFCESHALGIYTRNANNGYNGFLANLEGTSKDATEIRIE